MEILNIKTSRREELISINTLLSEIICKNNWQSGALVLFSPHTTSGLTVNENADPDVQTDICSFMRKLIPEKGGFLHAEGNSDAHLKASLFGPSLMIIVEGGELMLGTWQDVYFCEWDGPRQRQLWVQFLPSSVKCAK